jgi:hypothetical protein
MLEKLRELFGNLIINILVVIAFVLIGLYALSIVATFIMFPFALFS